MENWLVPTDEFCFEYLLNTLCSEKWISPEKKIDIIQGGNKLVKWCTAQLWPHFESCWLFKSTGGTPDVVHLIICTFQVLGWILEVNKALETKETFLSKYKYFGGFSHFKGGRHLLPYFSQQFLHKIIMFLCLLERKFPELFKTHPTFSSSALQKAKKSTLSA